MKRVLVVDDEQYIGLLIRFILKSEGYEVVVTDRVCEALAALEHAPFDLVFTDLNMPDQNGFELIEQLTKRQPHSNIVVITAQGEDEISQRALQLGARGVLLKPFSRQSLLKMARKFSVV